MKKSRARKAAKGARGPIGPRGRQGPPGKRGVAGQSAPHSIIDKLSTELEHVQKTLETQFTRIAQLQAELDLVRAGLKKAGVRKKPDLST